MRYVFGLFLDIFSPDFWISVGVGVFLGVLVSYNITRGIKLVVGRVNYWV